MSLLVLVLWDGHANKLPIQMLLMIFEENKLWGFQLPLKSRWHKFAACNKPWNKNAISLLQSTILNNAWGQWLESSPSIQTDLFSSLAYRWSALLCVAVEMVVNSNGGSGGGEEWMGPSYQGATMSLGLIKFSAAMHLSGVQPDNIGGSEHKVSSWTSCSSC